jgi:GNAT superfamily N-acetyltransferase
MATATDRMSHDSDTAAGATLPVSAELGHVDRIGHLMAAAFASNPWTDWLTDGDHADRQQIMPRYFSQLVAAVWDVSSVMVIGDDVGAPDAVAVWMHETATMPPPPDQPEAWLGQLCGRHTNRFHALDQALYQAERGNPPHRHLLFMAVRPPAQGRALGSTLLYDQHARLDRDGVPAYLEASSARARALYLRHGYRDLRPQPFRLPQGPPVWPMWRPSEGLGTGPDD